MKRPFSLGGRLGYMKAVRRDKPSLLERPAGGWNDWLDRSARALFPDAFDDATRARVALYLDEVLRWGSRVDLVAPRDVAEFIDLSLADALVVGRVELERGAASDVVVDVGSGGGAPGIPLFCLLARHRGLSQASMLVEPRTKRTAFLRSVVSQIGFKEVLVERSRSDVLADASFDVALARATLPPPEWLEEGARLSRGAVWVLLAKESAPEREGYRIDEDVRYVWPCTGVERRAVRYVPTTPRASS